MYLHQDTFPKKYLLGVTTSFGQELSKKVKKGEKNRERLFPSSKGAQIFLQFDDFFF